MYANISIILSNTWFGIQNNTELVVTPARDKQNENMFNVEA